MYGNELYLNLFFYGEFNPGHSKLSKQKASLLSFRI